MTIANGQRIFHYVAEEKRDNDDAVVACRQKFTDIRFERVSFDFLCPSSRKCAK